MRPIHCTLLVLGLVLLRMSVASAGEGGTIRGKVLVPASYSPLNAVVHLFTNEGRHLQTFVDTDGSFTLLGVPKGAHTLQADLMGLYYPEIRVETSAKGKLLRAVYIPPNSKQAMMMQEPLQLRPVGEMQYYEKRKPIDIWSFVKSPYGIMIVFGVFVVYVLPKMKVDPDEFKQFQDQVKGAPNGQPERAQGKRMERIQE